MTRLVPFFAAVFLTCGLAFGQDDRGALGLGITTAQTSPDIPVANLVRFNLFLDLGTRLYGDFYYGFELQGDVAQLSQDNFQLEQTDITTYKLGHGRWVQVYQTSYYQQTYTLWDLDLSPRGYISFDLGDKAQLLGFGGFNYNWQTLDYTIKNTGSTLLDDGNGNILAPGDSSTTSVSFNGNWQAVLGVRLSIALFYIDFTRYFNLTSSDLTVSNYDLSRFSLGLNLRF